MEKPLTEQCSSLLHQISSHPLFSIIITFFLLCLLYLPNLLPLFFSPVLITTSFLLSTLHHFGSPKPETTLNDIDTNPIKIQVDIPCEPTTTEFHEQKADDIFCSTLNEWGRKGGPLEVIYEEYEGEEDKADSPEYTRSPEYSHMTTSATNNRLDYFGSYGSTESEDSDGSSENFCFSWDEDEEGMIEIALEEDNLIEIDLSACRARGL